MLKISTTSLERENIHFSFKHRAMGNHPAHTTARAGGKCAAEKADRDAAGWRGLPGGADSRAGHKVRGKSGPCAQQRSFARTQAPATFFPP